VFNGVAGGNENTADSLKIILFSVVAFLQSLSVFSTMFVSLFSLFQTLSLTFGHVITSLHTISRMEAP
jgi:hypothetical protein